MASEKRSAAFNLRMAKSLIDDVAEQTKDVVRFTELAIEGKGSIFKAAGEIGRLNADLESAIDLANEASKVEPSIQLDDGTTCETVIAQARYQAGLLNFDLGHWDKAQRHFEDSHKIIPTQETAFNIALCLYNQVYAKGGGARYIRGLDGQKIYYAPIFAKKKARAEVKSAFERVINMDPDSDLAVEAGKIIIRLK